MPREEHSMEQMRLGAQGLEVAAIGLGCMGMSEFYGAADEAESIAAIHRAIELGMTFLDTADMYGPFKNERAGRQGDPRPARQASSLATKFGNVRGADGSSLGINGRPEYVRQACDARCSGSASTHIDLYYQHRVDPATPIEDTVGAMADSSRRQGALSRACRRPRRRRFAARARGPSDLPRCRPSTRCGAAIPKARCCHLRELGIGFVAYSPLGRGFLTGRWTEPSTTWPPTTAGAANPRFSGRKLPEEPRAGRQGAGAGPDQRRAPPAQLALAWVLARKGSSQRSPAPPSCATSRSYAGAPPKSSQTPAELARSSSSLPGRCPAAMRYHEASMLTVNR